MEFKRARNKHQKEIRTEQIIHAAIAQYNRMAFDRITLSGIAKELSFSRENIYKYFATKEEIFLRVISHDFESWAKELTLLFVKPLSLDDFAANFASALYGSKRLVELFSILTSTIEKNASLEHLTDFKKSMSAATAEAILALQAQFPGMTKQKTAKLLSILMHYAVGLYPSTNPGKVQKESIKRAGIAYQPPDFEKDYTEFIITVVRGLK